MTWNANKKGEGQKWKVGSWDYGGRKGERLRQSVTVSWVMWKT